MPNRDESIALSIVQFAVIFHIYFKNVISDRTYWMYLLRVFLFREAVRDLSVIALIYTEVCDRLRLRPQTIDDNRFLNRIIISIILSIFLIKVFFL